MSVRILLLAILLLASVSGARAVVFFAPTNAIWKMQKGLAEASAPDPSAWRQVGFDDSSWTEAPAPIFYTTVPPEPPFYDGVTALGTTLNDMQNRYSSVYFRKTFVVSNATSLSGLNLVTAVDDGFIVWVNGVEVLRANVPAGVVPFNAFALVSPTEPMPVNTFAITNGNGLLVNGANVLAVHAFNRSLDSSDFGFMAGLASAVDDVPPEVASLNPPPDVTLHSLTQIEVRFNEPVAGVEAADLLINGVPVTGVISNAPDRYLFSFAQPQTFVVTMAWEGAPGIRDSAGNSFAGGNWTYFLDTNVLAGTAVISEFMAENHSTLLDEDGESSDWIEIYNPGTTTVSLDGWYLTDKVANPILWRFPAVDLQAGAYRIVFASGKNRAVPGASLHTNFKLDADGSYLALLRPDGTTIATEFAPLFPRQRPDTSYGPSREVLATPLIAIGASVSLLIPTNNDGGRNWTGGAEPYGDSTGNGWISATNGVGFDQSPVGGSVTAPPIGYWDFDNASNATQARDASGNNHHGAVIGAAFTPDAGGRSGRAGDRAMNFGPANNGAYINVPDAALGIFDSAVTHNAITFSLWIFGDANQPGLNSAFYVSGNEDGSGVRVANAHLPWTDNVIYWDTGGYDGSQRVSVPEPDSTKWKGRWNHYVFLKNGNTKQIWQNGTKILEAFNSDPLHPARGFVIGSGANLSVWSYGGLIDEFAVWDVALTPAQIQALASGTRPLNLDTLVPLIRTDLGAAMRHRNASAYLRARFAVTGPIDFDLLLLRVRYDDGFVCYLNGTEVARRNAPAAVTFNSAATLERTKSAASQVEELNLSTFLHLLHPGTNVLSLHGLNFTAADADFLLQPELLAGRSSAPLFFTTPTPGAVNGTGVAGFVADTAFSVDRGFFFAPTNVVVSSATPGGTLVYTTDGTVPTLNNGTRVDAGSPTTPPSVTFPITKTTLLRAAAFKTGYEPTDVDTHTYLFPGPAATQNRPGWIPATWPGGFVADFAMDSRVVNGTLPGYSLSNALLSIPTLSIVTPSNGLFSAGTGIYANALQDSAAWERPISAELMYPDGREGFHIRCGFRIHGGSSRYKEFTPKHSFSLLFRAEFGPTKLDFPLFTNSPVRKFDQLIVRGCSTDSWPVQYGVSQSGEPWPRWFSDEASYMRDQWMRDAQNDLGHPSGHGLYVHLYLDGLYWGLYNLVERVDDSFAAAYCGGDKEEYDVLADFGEVHSGNSGAWNEMMGLVSGGLSSDAAVQRLQGNNPDGTRNTNFPVYLNLTNLIDYMILHIHSGADDWPNHNWWASRRRGPLSEGFRFFVWDQELANNSLERTRTSWPPFPRFADVATGNTPAAIYAGLRQNAEFRQTFGDRVHRHLFNNGQLAPATNTTRWQARHTEIDRAMVAESARWGDYRRATAPYRREVEWVSNQTWMVNTYWPSNLAVAVARFRAASLYPSVGAPNFNPFGGSVPAGFPLAITHTNGAGTIYYTVDGSDPRRPGGAVTAGALVYAAPVVLTSPTLVRARVRNGSTWSALTEATFYTPQDFTKLQLSEIMYNPPKSGTNDGDGFEFLELNNIGAVPLELDGLKLTSGLAFTFTNGTRLAPGGFLVLARDTALFSTRYPGAPVHGLYTGRLENHGETITLSHPLGGTIFSVTYLDTAPWPAEADDSGLSLQRMNFTIGMTNARSWIAALPTPGGPLAPELVDTDGDGMSDGWEFSHGLNPATDDAERDPDGDGLTNYEEFIAGTDPRNEEDDLRFREIETTPTPGGLAVALSFPARPYKTYSVGYRHMAATSGWTNLVSVSAHSTNRLVTVTNLLTPGTASRFYRLITPRLP